MTRNLKSESETRDRFVKDTAEHQMTVLHDDGLYKHLLFKKPGTSFYWFEVVTWPGHLTINGDMGTYTFAREQDMLGFFRHSDRRRINADYWAEKLRGPESGRAAAKEYDEQTYRRHVMDHVTDWLCWEADRGDVTSEEALKLWGAVWTELLDPKAWDYPGGHQESAREAINGFEHTLTMTKGDTAERVLGSRIPTGRKTTFRFEDTWEWDLTGYSLFFLWCCYAIQDGIHRYDEQKQAANA